MRSGRWRDERGSAAVEITLVAPVLVLVGYPLAFETATRGRTLGMMAMGLRVVSEDGGPERFRQALFRALAGVIEIWMLMGAPAVICSVLFGGNGWQAVPPAELAQDIE